MTTMNDPARVKTTMPQHDPTAVAEGRPSSAEIFFLFDLAVRCFGIVRFFSSSTSFWSISTFERMGPVHVTIQQVSVAGVSDVAGAEG